VCVCVSEWERNDRDESTGSLTKGFRSSAAQERQSHKWLIGAYLSKHLLCLEGSFDNSFQVP
jgi:hypothetical protein